MVKKPLELFVDTNLFFEGKRLEDLPWADLGADTIILVVVRPVLAEIDKHKKAGGRTKKRALETYGRVRTMIENGRDDEIISNSDPRVIFRLAHGLKFDPDLEGELDKTATDDWLMGALSLRLKQDPDANACLFTHDSGLISAALSFDLPYRLIKADWLRPPENDAQEKRIIALEQELDGYRAQEPKISIALNGDETAPTSIALKETVFRPLTVDEVDKLMDELTRRYPIATDFDATTMALRAASNVNDIKINPPSDEDVAQYRNTDYPAWTDRCREIFAKLHETLKSPCNRLTLTYVMTNEGARPAKNALVSFQTEGDLWLNRFDAEDDDEREAGAIEQSPPTSLDKPPTAPRPTTVYKRPEVLLDQIDASGINAANAIAAPHKELIDAVAKMQKHSVLSTAAATALNAVSAPNPAFGPTAPDRFLPNPLSSMRNGYDPEAFYYDEWPSAVPVQSGALTCELWRHRSGDEFFNIEIDFGVENTKTGAIYCAVHAENLTAPATHRIRIERVIEDISPFKHAMDMIEKLNPPKRKRRLRLRRTRFNINVIDKPETRDGDNTDQ